MPKKETIESVRAAAKTSQQRTSQWRDSSNILYHIEPFLHLLDSDFDMRCKKLPAGAYTTSILCKLRCIRFLIDITTVLVHFVRERSKRLVGLEPPNPSFSQCWLSLFVGDAHLVNEVEAILG